MNKGFKGLISLLVISVVIESLFIVHLSINNSNTFQDAEYHKSKYENLQKDYKRLFSNYTDVQKELRDVKFEKSVKQRNERKSASKKQTQRQERLVWLNTRSGVWHNSSCFYYKNTTYGKLTSRPWGRACQRCGG